MLRLAGMRDPGRAVIYGMEEYPAFRKPVLEEYPVLDSDAIESGLTAVAEMMVAAHPEIGTILLECSNMPCYAHAVQKSAGRPVFDFTSLIGMYYAAAFRRPFHGQY